MRPPRRRPVIYVAIVSKSSETLEALEAYLKQVGVPSHGTRAVHDLSMAAPAFATAAVIFPDDFEAGEAFALVRELRRQRPHMLVVIVTREPARFRAISGAADRSAVPIVLPRPSFGWEILDAIRAHAAETLSPKDKDA